ncbi:DUF3122 domain-containing protein [Pantanalinema sp. GBBB05]|uniref:DUF3122 domain-containing protein n=1 Tax=Pantanalinema sp. GBBB05 TaxID=2604139 RepID=UPI001D968EC5|nr:DUF3122 domain-containing protein [Pantanalinema sp. GBBB05]
MGCQIRQVFSWFLWLGAIVLAVLLGFGLWHPPSAAAAIRQLEESPGQVVYQSRQTLNDQHGNNWQTVAFKRIRSDGKASFELRVVGFPGVVELDHTQPLTLTNSLGAALTATNVSNTIFPNAAQPVGNIGQYNLQPLIAQLPATIPLKLSLPTISGETINLAVSPLLVEEWQTVANY